MTGAEAAAHLLRDNGLHDVQIEEVRGDEIPGAKKVLDAASLTYVAAAPQLLYYVMLLAGSDE